MEITEKYKELYKLAKAKKILKEMNLLDSNLDKKLKDKETEIKDKYKGKGK